MIKGFDRAIPQMSIGERSKLIVSADYGYGAEGLFPLIPPNSSLRFDITLLGFRPRAIWVKPLVQAPGLCEKPYMATKKSMMRDIVSDGKRGKDKDDGSTVHSGSNASSAKR